MAEYALSGFGTRALTGGTGALHVSVTTRPLRASVGNAWPTNRFKVGLLRFGDGIGWGDALPLLDGPQRLDVPPWGTQLGWSMFPNGVIDVTEVPSVAAGSGNPLRLTREFSGSLAAGTNNQQLWSYQVPAGRLFVCEVGSVAIQKTADNYAAVTIQTTLNQLLFAYSPSTGNFNEYQLSQLPTRFRLAASEEILSFASNFATKALNVISTLMGWEYDASAWTPPTA